MATTFMGAAAAEAEIHYSGLIKETFDAYPQSTSGGTFPLEGGASLVFLQGRAFNDLGVAWFNLKGPQTESFRGNVYGGQGFPAKLSLGASVSTGSFAPATLGLLYLAFHHGGPNSQFDNRGGGFIGFRFDIGNGLQYGWVRVKMSGAPDNAIKVLDYAWGDPGDQIKAGQKSSSSNMPHEGSLGLLALGAAGLLAWRERRKQL